MIAQRREALGYTQKQFADLLGVYDRTIQRWESEGSPGAKTPSEMLEICNAYKWTLEELAISTGKGSEKGNVDAVSSAVAETSGSYKQTGRPKPPRP